MRIELDKPLLNIWTHLDISLGYHNTEEKYYFMTIKPCEVHHIERTDKTPSYDTITIEPINPLNRYYKLINVKRQNRKLFNKLNLEISKNLELIRDTYLSNGDMIGVIAELIGD